MIKKYKHISFDLDGTLVHTTPEYRHEVVPRIVSELGGCIKDPRTVDMFWFEAGRNEIIKNHFGLEPEIFWNLFVQIDTPEKRSLHTHAYEDAEPSLKRLKDLNKTISIVTGAPDWIARMEIEKLNGIEHDYYLSLNGGQFSGKPDPRSLEFVMDKLAVAPQDTIYIGNSNEDAYYAKNAGVDFIYLERNEHSFDLKDYSVATIRSLNDLFD